MRTGTTMWLARMPTIFHLWCAESELRSVDVSNMTPAVRRARSRNLDLLRRYRQGGEFPENRHEPTRLAPCFVDPEGRKCAVAFLMHEAGVEATVRRVAREANYSRIRDMHFSELDSWAGDSGLSKAELGRIQPGYPPTPEQAATYAQIIVFFWLSGALALNSILFNCIRLVRAHRPRITTIATGLVLGTALLFYAFGVNSGQLAHTRLYWEVQDTRLYAIGIGILAMIWAIIPLCTRRGKWQLASSNSRPEQLSDTSIPSIPNEHVQAAKRYEPRRPAENPLTDERIKKQKSAFCSRPTPSRVTEQE